MLWLYTLGLTSDLVHWPRKTDENTCGCVFSVNVSLVKTKVLKLKALLWAPLKDCEALDLGSYMFSFSPEGGGRWGVPNSIGPFSP